MTAIIRRALIIRSACRRTVRGWQHVLDKPHAGGPIPQVTLNVAGAVNATPALTVAGRTVAAVWTATKDGATNVYLATSADGGATVLRARTRQRSGWRREREQRTTAARRHVRIGRTANPHRVLVEAKRRAAENAPRCDPHGAFDRRRPHVSLPRASRTTRRCPAHGDGSRSPWAPPVLCMRCGSTAVTPTERSPKRQRIRGWPHKGQPPQDIYHGDDRLRRPHH